ncbi:MAG: hypothetical protein IJ486_09855 [Firmicutes bacterium]|nr:hypothetical protein [Bacillota bacterium]
MNNITRDEAFRVVCEFRTPNSSQSYTVGTGMFISAPIPGNPDRINGWIVTATHVAVTTNQLTKIVIATEGGRAVTLSLTDFAPLHMWRHHPVADVSALPIQWNERNLPHTKRRFVPTDHVNMGRTPVSRDYELTAIGFPHGLGVGGSFSPLTFRSYASSGFITLNRADTKKPSEFFCLENPSVGGYSGGPVFSLGYMMEGNVRKVYDITICHGIMHGTLSDSTGGKIALVTPAFYLKDILF